MTQASVGIVMHELLNLKLPFVIRSPRSAIVDAPTWYVPAFENDWTITVFNHEKKEMFCGSGDTLPDAMNDLRQGLDPKRQHDLGDINLPKL